MLMRRESEPQGVSEDLTDWAANFRALDTYVAENLSDTRPLACPDFPFTLKGKGPAELAKDVVFGTYRAKVTEIEAQNAARLELLSNVFLRLAKRGDQPELIERVGTFIERVYRVALPMEVKDVRSWARAKTLRHDLLPNSWREL